jgi:hypothetical protein
MNTAKCLEQAKKLLNSLSEGDTRADNNCRDKLHLTPQKSHKYYQMEGYTDTRMGSEKTAN